MKRQLSSEREELIQQERKKHEGDLKFELNELKQEYEQKRKDLVSTCVRTRVKNEQKRGLFVVVVVVVVLFASNTSRIV